MRKARGERREATSRPKAIGQRSKQAAEGRPQAKGQRPKQAAIRVPETVIPRSAVRDPHFIPHSALRVPQSVSRSAGYSLVEMVVAVAIFGIFLVVLVGLQGEFLKHDREVRVALFTHPAPLAVMARVRRDVLDSRGYPESAGSWSQTPETLLLDVASDDATPRVVVWDFRDPTIARRLELGQGGEQVASWEARAVPHYTIDSWKAPDGRVGVLVTAKDNKGNVVVDQIVTPRAR